MGNFKKNKIGFRFQVSGFIMMAFSLLIVFGLTGDVQASVGLSVSPQKFDLIVFPGDSYRGMFKITNPNDFALPVSVRAVPFGAEEGTGEMRFEKIDPESPSLWFTFETDEMILEPKETRRVNFKVNVPLGIEPGGYYVFAYFEPRFPSHYFMEKGPKVIPIIGVPFLISSAPLLLDPEKGKEFEVLDFSVSKEERVKILEDFFNLVSERTRHNLAAVGVVQAADERREVFFSQKPPSFFSVRIKNNDIYHLKPSGTLLIYNIFGKKIGEAELRGQTILPGKSREFKIVFIQENKGFTSQVLGLILSGKTRAELDVKALSPVRGELFLTESNPFLTFFSLTAFYFLIAFAIIIMIIYFARKRIKLVLQVLFKK